MAVCLLTALVAGLFLVVSVLSDNTYVFKGKAIPDWSFEEELHIKGKLCSCYDMCAAMNCTRYEVIRQTDTDRSCYFTTKEIPPDQLEDTTDSTFTVYHTDYRLIDGIFYKLYSRIYKSFDEATTFCREDGGQLAVANTRAKVEALHKLFAKTRLERGWVSLKRNYSPTRVSGCLLSDFDSPFWKFNNGTTLTIDSTWSYQHTGICNKCLHFNKTLPSSFSDSKWCSVKQEFVCERHY